MLLVGSGKVLPTRQSCRCALMKVNSVAEFHAGAIVAHLVYVDIVTYVISVTTLVAYDKNTGALQIEGHMIIKAIAATFLGVAVLIGLAHARDQLDDLKDVCNYAASDQEARLINATAMLVPAGAVHPNPGLQTYYIDTQPFYYTDVDQGTAICTDSRFYAETAVVGGRTGVLIAPDMILTAPHVNPIDPTQWAVVFRASMATLGGVGCSNFTWSSIPASDVYFPASHSTVMNSFGGATGSQYDYAVFQLAVPVVGRAPVKIRRSGAPRFGDIVISPGYPNHTAEKLSSATVFTGIEGATGGPRLPGDYLYAHFLNGFVGSSGSPLWDVEDETIDAGVRESNNTGLVFDPVAQCSYASEIGLIAAVNGPIVGVASLIPRAEVLVAPLDYVDRILDIHPSSPTFTNHYTATTARAGQGGELIDIEKISWPSGTGDPNVSLSIPTGFYNAPANGPLTFDVNADISNVNTCGTWDYELNVHDITNDQNNIIRHHFEIGLREYSVTPDDDWVVNDLSAPYQESKTYTLTNVRPTPTHVMVSQDSSLPDSDLILINGTATASFDLGPKGSGTDTATVVLTLNQTVAAATTLGVEYHGRIAIYNQPFNCSAPPDDWYIYRNLTFKRGEQIFTGSPATGFLPPPAAGQPYGTPVRFDLDLSGEDASTCVQDLNLYLGVPPGLNGLTVAYAASFLKIQVTPPGGVARVLWQSNALPGSEYERDVLDAQGDSIPALYLDDQIAPPLGPYLLSAFNGWHARGHWYMDVSSSGPGFLVTPAQLDFTRTSSGICLH